MRTQPLGASVFAWSLTNGLASPFDAHFTFVALALLDLIIALTAHRNFALDADTSPSLEAPVAAPSVQVELDGSKETSTQQRCEHENTAAPHAHVTRAGPDGSRK